MTERKPERRTTQRKIRARGRSQRRWPIYVGLVLIAAALVLATLVLPRASAPPPVRLPDLSSEQPSSVGEDPASSTNAPIALPRNDPSSDSMQEENATGNATNAPSGSISAPSDESAAFRGSRGDLYFVIDDVGNNVTQLRPFLSFPGPLTLSILPQRPYSLDAYRQIVAAGKEPILHQPMEAGRGTDPGDGTITTAMSTEQIDDILTRDLAGMERVTWINNHEGSVATSDPATMTAVLRYLTAHGMHYLDSRTSAQTAVPEVAAELGLPYFQRNSAFLDDSTDADSIVKAINAGLAVAAREGYAVMIGHVWDDRLPGILIGLYPKLVADGYRIYDIRMLEKEPALHERSGN